MKAFVVSSNQYSHLLNAYIALFNKYWEGQPLTILCYDLPDVNSNGLVEIISLGKQEESWTNPLIPYFKKLDEDYFAVLLEDFLLKDYVDNEKMDLLETEIKEGRADKAVLYANLQKVYGEPHPTNPRLSVIKQDAKFRATLCPSIWRREYFLKFLRPDISAWEFEEMGMVRARNDGKTIISLKEDRDLFSTINVYIKGKFLLEQQMKKMPHKEDRELILSHL